MMNQQSSACYLILIHCDLSFVQLDVAVLVAAQELPRGFLQPACFACERCFFGLGWLIFNILAHVEGKKRREGSQGCTVGQVICFVWHLFFKKFLSGHYGGRAEWVDWLVFSADVGVIDDSYNSGSILDTVGKFTIYILQQFLITF